MMELLPVILAGGGGTRLWPLSRAHFSKQFLSIAGTRSLLQDTLLRLDALAADGCERGPTLVVCNEAHRELVALQSREAGVDPAEIILEPVGRNTAPALTCAALRALASRDDALLIMMPADHIIARPEVFRAAVATGIPHAMAGAIVTFGIVPDKPETGYGYIRIDAGAALPANLAGAAHGLQGFVEKPDLATARGYLAQGCYLWNSGIFMLRARVWLAAIARYRADIAQAAGAAVAGGHLDRGCFRLAGQAFAACPSESIDYAVMEHIARDRATQGVVIGLDAGWSDVGSWSSLWEIGAHDAAGNLARGDVCLIDAANNLVYSQERFVAALGCQDLVIVETADAVLVAPRSHAQQVRKVVEVLERDGRREHRVHRRALAAWGHRELLAECGGSSLELLTLAPGARAELAPGAAALVHLSGAGRARIRDQVTALAAGSVLALAPGQACSLENPGADPLVLACVGTAPAT